MAAIILPSQWTRQPQVPVGINWSNPLTRGLVFVYLPGVPFDLVGKRLAKVVTAPSLGFGPGGRTGNWDASTTSIYFDRDAALEPSELTALAYLRRTLSLPAYCRPFGKTYGNATSPYVSYDIEYNPGSAGQNVVAANSSDSGILRTTPNATIGDTTLPHTSGVRYGGGVLAAIYNGASVSTASVPTPQYDTSSTGNFIVSGASAASAVNVWGGDIYVQAIWNRALSDAELVQWNANPWQIFAPISRKMLFGVAAAGTPTGTLAYTNANDTLAASGSAVGFTGTLAKTNANDTLAASGTQTNTGTLAKTNANDTLAGVGFLSTSGTLATTNSADTLVARGTAAGGDPGWLGPGPGAYDFLNPRKNIELSPDPIEVVAKSIATGIVEKAARKERDEGAYLKRVRQELDAHKIEVDRNELKRLRKQIRQRDEEDTLTALLMTL